MAIQADSMRVLLGNTIAMSIAIILLSSMASHSFSTNQLEFSRIGTKYSDEPTNSTNFTSSGGSGLAVSGEPGYVGDTLTASMMVTNSGNVSASVSLLVASGSGDATARIWYIPNVFFKIYTSIHFFDNYTVNDK